MRRLLMTTMIFAASPICLHAATLDKALAKLDPEERARQACIIRGIDQIRTDKKLPKADRIQPGAEKRAALADGVVMATGGAVRAKDQWFALKFKCSVTEDHMKATSFTYEIGAAIPEEQWEDLGLFK